MHMQPVAHSGLYHPDEFRDNCGFGLIAHMQGQASHHLVQTSIHSLSCMTHRGAIAADGKTGDGCGLLLALPQDFFRAVAKTELGVELNNLFAAGLVFLNSDPALAVHAKQVLSQEIEKDGLSVVGWRVVPTDNSILGEIALRTLPVFNHVFVNAPDGMDKAEFNRKLFMARRRAESGSTNCTVNPFSCRSLAATIPIGPPPTTISGAVVVTTCFKRSTVCKPTVIGSNTVPASSLTESGNACRLVFGNVR